MQGLRGMATLVERGIESELTTGFEGLRYVLITDKNRVVSIVGGVNIIEE